MTYGITQYYAISRYNTVLSNSGSAVLSTRNHSMPLFKES